MVSRDNLQLCLICVVAMCLAATGKVYAERGENQLIAQPVSADACDDRMVDDDTQTAENRAVDKASLSAVKLSGIIQRQHPELSANAIDIIAYRIIDEYMVNVAHAIKFADSDRICVKLMGEVEISANDLDLLVEEYKDSEAPAEQIAEVVAQVKNDTAFKPENLNEKKLLYVQKMVFWNGNETDHYRDLLTGLMSGSEYFYVTEDESVADYVVRPRLVRSEVDEIDKNNHKMQMAIELEITSPTNRGFASMSEQQNHAVLFASDKDEQKIADDLLRKLLTKASKEAYRKIDKYAAVSLEKSKMYGK